MGTLTQRAQSTQRVPRGYGQMIICLARTLREDGRYVPQRDLVPQPSQAHLRERRKNRPERRNLPFVLDTPLF